MSEADHLQRPAGVHSPLHSEKLLEIGTREAAAVARRQLSDYRWVVSGVPAESRRELDAVWGFAARTLTLMRLRSTPIGIVPEWEAAREDLRLAIRGEVCEGTTAAALDVFRRHGVPRQFLFDLQDAVDAWIRFGGFDDDDAWRQFACRFGGSLMQAALCILGTHAPCDVALTALAGQAVALAQLLARFRLAAGDERLLIPKSVVEAEALDVSQPLDAAGSRRLAAALRRLASQVEWDFFEAAGLLPQLSYEGQRVLKSLFAVHWQLLNKIKESPLDLLVRPAALARREMARLRWMHLLGTEGRGVPIVPHVEPQAESHGS